MTIKRKNLLIRIIVALAFGPAVIYSLYVGGVFLLVLLLAIVFGLLAEFGALPSVKFNALQEGFLVGSGMLMLFFFWIDFPVSQLSCLIVFSAVWFLLELLRRPMEGSLERSAFGPFAIVLFSIVPSLAIELNRANPLYAVLPIALVWCGDTVAYFAGNVLKGPKMTPVLSPNKTWAGFFGEIIGAALIAVVFRLIWPHIFDWGILLFAIPAGIIAVLGDLFESKVKRELNIKDSSMAIPGHGGIWDRFDSWLFVQLWAWVYFALL